MLCFTWFVRNALVDDLIGHFATGECSMLAVRDALELRVEWDSVYPCSGCVH